MARIFTVRTAIQYYFCGAILENELVNALENNEIPYVKLNSKYLMREEAIDNWATKNNIKKGERR